MRPEKKDGKELEGHASQTGAENTEKQRKPRAKARRNNRRWSGDGQDYGARRGEAGKKRDMAQLA